VEGLAKKSGNPRFAYDCYRRFIQMFGEVALEVEMELFDEAFDERKHKVKAKLDTDLNAEDLKAIIVEYKKIVKKATKKDFPAGSARAAETRAQRGLRILVEPKANYIARWKRSRTDIGTAANVQAMVFGNMGDTCCTGVGFHA